MDVRAKLQAIAITAFKTQNFYILFVLMFFCLFLCKMYVTFTQKYMYLNVKEAWWLCCSKANIPGSTSLAILPFFFYLATLHFVFHIALQSVLYQHLYSIACQGSNISISKLQCMPTILGTE